LIDIDVSGLDELERDLQEMVDGLTMNVLNEWAAKILEVARSNVPEDKRDSITLQFQKKEGKRFDIVFHSPEEYVQQARAAIELFLPQMPLTTQQAFQGLLDRM
jgi:hypothetical protein